MSLLKEPRYGDRRLKMYRTEEIFEEIKNEPLKYPICVPSYDRPNNPFIEWVKTSKFDIPKDNLFMFIRNTPEQKALYEPLNNLVNLVLISKDTKDVGDTRAQIVKWGQKHNHELLFMLDDTVKGVWWLTTIERKGQVFLDMSRVSTPKVAFQIWAEEHLRNKMIATSIGWKGFHWMPNRINLPIESLNGAALSGCIGISPMKWLEAGINYKPMEETGVEELYLAYQLLKNKLPFCLLADFCYEVKTVAFGGNNSVAQNQNRFERLFKIQKDFWEKTLGLQWGEKHPGFRVVKGRSEPYNIRINYPYWRKYYEDTE